MTADHIPALMEGENYFIRSDLYSFGIFLPRMILLPIIIGLIAYSLRASRAVMITTFSASLVLGVLFLKAGYKDEFRALGILFPFLYLVTITPGRRVEPSSYSAK